MASVSDVTKAILAFESDLYQECAKSTYGNLVCSPLSIASALMLLAQGANGKTLKKLTAALHLTDDKKKTAKGFCEHVECLSRGAGSTEFTIANLIYVQKKYRLLGEFLDVAFNDFGSNIKYLDFENNVESADVINKFIEENTKGLIKNAMSPDVLSPVDRVILVNVLYFKAKWLKTFKKHHTFKGDFYVDATKTVSVDFMRQDTHFNFGDIAELDATALEMQYNDSNLAFVIVLPKKRTGLAALEAKLKNYDSTKIAQQMKELLVDVIIPKFKIMSDIDLKSTLQMMGLTDMFTPMVADFSCLAHEIPGEPLFVSTVAHKCCITVDELGTEAAAASYNSMRGGACPPCFRADHPFVFYIWDRLTQTSLFTGRITNFTA